MKTSKKNYPTYKFYCSQCEAEVVKWTANEVIEGGYELWVSCHGTNRFIFVAKEHWPENKGVEFKVHVNPETQELLWWPPQWAWASLGGT